MTLHLTYAPNMTVRERLDRWDNAVRRNAALGPGDWRLFAVWPAARDASISGSTGIEGNPLDPDQVADVLAGAAVDADAAHIREVENYNRALNLARDAAMRPDFEWSHDFVHLINATVMEGLPRDTRGNYRGPGEEISVGVFEGPSPLLVPSLMDELIVWLRAQDATTPLVRSALLHLNLIAIHPFNDGNGRTSRILAAVEIVRDGVRSPELISIEAYLRRHREEYIDALRTTLGMSYDPDNHPATHWIDFYTRISLDRLDARNRILDALPTDLGVLVSALADHGEPLEWATVLLAARVGRLRTARLAEMTGRSAAAARAELGRLTRAGWLEPRGVTRGRWYAPSERLSAIQLYVPGLMRLLAAGERLALFDEEMGT
ncbi:MAG: Fic family protein [Acidobacteria bacterium]|nr:Fic family protein [Acidobacteriota bacterium]